MSGYRSIPDTMIAGTCSALLALSFQSWRASGVTRAHSMLAGRMPTHEGRMERTE